MSAVTYVGIADYKIISQPGVLASSALGSCVGVCLWDTQTHLAGLLHLLLPSSNESTDKTNHAKFADLGITQLVAEMESRGAVRSRLRAKLTGGACLYHYEAMCHASEIGSRNITASRMRLRLLGIPVIAEHVGGEYGRSVRLNQENFEVRVHVLSQGIVII